MKLILGFIAVLSALAYSDAACPVAQLNIIGHKLITEPPELVAAILKAPGNRTATDLALIAAEIQRIKAILETAVPGLVITYIELTALPNKRDGETSQSLVQIQAHILDNSVAVKDVCDEIMKSGAVGTVQVIDWNGRPIDLVNH